ncbi:MAG: trans-sulfuration enzyme family protein [Chthoniobacterales bacterium]
MKIETIAVHAGQKIDSATGAVAPPIHMSTTFVRDAEGNYPHGFVYGRGNNPTREGLERALAAIEGGAVAAAFSSGSAAISAVFQALPANAHAVIADDVYHGTRKLIRDLFVPLGLQADFVDLSDVEQAGRAIRAGTKLVWTETPSNPLLKITDLPAVADLAHKVGALCVSDNTLAPIIQRPLDHGIDFVMHSTTKYLGGHSDVMGGALIARESNELFEQIRNVQGTGGAIPSPFDCWLIHRGIRSLPWRMRAHCENAARIAEFLNKHSAVERVHYPGLTNHRGHEIAVRQMTPFGALFSFEVKAGRDAAVRAAGRTRLFVQATSLGGVESLIEHRASIQGEDPRTPQGLLRLSVGLENADDLIADLDQALA